MARGLETHSGHVTLHGKALHDVMDLVKRLNMQGSSLRVITATDHIYTPAQRDLRIDPVAFHGALDLIVLEGTVSALDIGVWPTNAYVQIGMRTQEQAGLPQTSNGVWLIFTPTSTQYKIEMQDVSGVSFEPVYVDKTVGVYQYRIIIMPATRTAYADIWTTDDKSDVQTTGTITYGVEQFGADTEKIEDFSSAHLYYALLGSADALSVETYTATIGDVTSNPILGQTISDMS